MINIRASLNASGEMLATSFVGIIITTSFGGCFDNMCFESSSPRDARDSKFWSSLVVLDVPS